MNLDCSFEAFLLCVSSGFCALEFCEAREDSEFNSFILLLFR